MSRPAVPAVHAVPAVLASLHALDLQLGQRGPVGRPVRLVLAPPCGGAEEPAAAGGVRAGRAEHAVRAVLCLPACR